MFVVTVIPIKRGITLDSLSYFSSQVFPVGSIVNIPVRSVMILGLVTNIQEVSTAKTALRAATFSLRKLPQQKHLTMLGEPYIKTVRELSEHYASSISTILYNLLPPEIRNGDITIPHTYHIQTQKAETPQILQAHKNDRLLAYRSLVRETFAHSGSVLIIVPSSIDAVDMKDALEPGIADRIIVFSNSATKTELKKAYELIEDFSKTKLIIATPSHAVIERHDIILMIVEHARSSSYKEMQRPYLDYRDVLRIHAFHTGRKIIFGDLLLRSEEEYMRRTEQYSTYGETPKRIELQGKFDVIEMKPYESGKPMNIFSDEVIQAIKEVRKKRGKIFLFAARRGIAPLITCMDCGFIFRSKESGAPYSLLKTTKNGVEERWFVCSASGERIRAHDTCTVCGSWRLRERGVGIQHMYDEFRKIFPQVPTTLFDHTTAKTYKRALFLRDTFYKTKGGVLIGTYMAIPYMTKSVDLSIVVNMDTLLSTPTWRLEEENLALLLALREVTTGKVLAQMRATHTDILSYAKYGSVEQFYTEELALREKFNYPPFSTFLHFTWQGTPDVIAQIQSDIELLLKEYPISFYAHPSVPQIMYGLIRLPCRAWPDAKLATLLHSVHPSVRIVINPDKII